METWPHCPAAGPEGFKGPRWPRWVQTQVSAVYTQEGGRRAPHSQAMPRDERGEV